MQSLIRIVIDIFVITVVVATALFAYINYSDDIIAWFTEDKQVIFVGDLAIEVIVADEQDERLKGLSDKESIEELEGAFFIFDRSDHYGIWMKDMNFPIDIIWVNENLEIVDIAENVTPNSYPKVYRPDEPARFVLEMNAYFAKTFKVEIGQRLNVPSVLLPEDVRLNLQ